MNNDKIVSRINIDMECKDKEGLSDFQKFLSDNILDGWMNLTKEWERKEEFRLFADFEFTDKKEISYDDLRILNKIKSGKYEEYGTEILIGDITRRLREFSSSVDSIQRSLFYNIEPSQTTRSIIRDLNTKDIKSEQDIKRVKDKLKSFKHTYNEISNNCMNALDVYINELDIQMNKLIIEKDGKDNMKESFIKEIEFILTKIANEKKDINVVLRNKGISEDIHNRLKTEMYALSKQSELANELLQRFKLHCEDDKIGGE